MADAKTLKAYQEHAGDYCADWLSQKSPAELLPLIAKYFVKDAPTADIGCGSGREVDWLSRHGYPCVGYDVSPALLKEAQRLFPSARFETAELPALAEIADASFSNLLCETVIMHLPGEQHAEALQNLLRVLKPGGHLILSWRTPADPSGERDARGRLYAPFSEGNISALNIECLHREELVSASSGKPIVQVVLRRKK